VEDVLSSIYRSLRTNLTSSEFNTFQTPTDQQCAIHAYKQRYRRQRSVRIYEEEKRGGMKRVDFLMGHTQFLGISNDSHQPEKWCLHVGIGNKDLGTGNKHAGTGKKQVGHG
jgi:hypothetical protein